MFEIIILAGIIIISMKNEAAKMKYYSTIKSYRDNFFRNITDISLVFAIIQQESGFDEHAVRYEPQISDASYGLMQVLYQTAKWLGYQGEPVGLYNFEKNIYYGMKYLDYCIAHTKAIEIAISAYNAGVKGASMGRGIEYRESVMEKWVLWQKYFDENNLKR